MTEIQNKLFSMQDKKYRAFQANLTPSVSSEKMIGVRTLDLRAYAGNLVKEAGGTSIAFIEKLPHEYFDENQLHAFIISREKDFYKAVDLVEAFLPYVDNWATCDQLSPKIFAKNPGELEKYAEKWIKSDHVYTIRFGIRMFMNYFLGGNYSEKAMKQISELVRPHIANGDGNYYINMMISWYFATALSRNWEETLPFIKEKRLNDWCHKKTIQKARESYRVSEEHKALLKTLV